MSGIRVTIENCICCNKAGNMGIKVDIPIDNIAISQLIFCENCMNEPGIFLDYTPYDVLQGKAHPRKITPNFGRYLLTRARATTDDQPLVWKGFVK